MHEQDYDFSFKNLLKFLFTSIEVRIIAGVALIVFFNSLLNGFVWDDISQIVYNNEVHSFNFTKLFGPSLMNSASYYRPITATYFALLYSIAHDQAFLYHLIQLTLHIICTIAIFALFMQLVDKKSALFLALIFLVHPMNVESVSYISAASQLYSLPGLLALLLLQIQRPTKMTYVAVIALFLFSLLAKEEGILFMLVALAYVLLFRQKYVKHLIIVESLVMGIYLLVRFLVGREDINSLHEFLLRGHDTVINLSKVVPIAHLPFHEKLLNVPEIIFYYLKTFIYPYNLVINQIWVISQNPASIYVPLFIDFMVFLVLILLAIYLYKSKRKFFKSYLFFLIWFVVGLGFHLPIFIPADMTVADRWFYFTMIGLLGVLGITVLALLDSKKIRTLVFWSTIVLIIILSLRTVVRNTNFVDDIALYTHDAKLQPNYMIELDLGQKFLEANNPEAALIHLQNSDKMFRTSRSLYTLGFANEYVGNAPKALEYYTYAYQYSNLHSQKPKQELYHRLSYVMLKIGDYATARSILQEGLKYYPQDDILWQQLAVSEYLLHNQINALKAMERAIAISSSKQNQEIFQLIKERQPISIP